MLLKTKGATNEYQYFMKNKVRFIDTLSSRTFFWDAAAPCGSENIQNVGELNPNKDKKLSTNSIPYFKATYKKNFHRKVYVQSLVIQI